MKEKEILHAVGMIQPHDRTKKNNASYNAGFLGSKKPLYSKQEQDLLDSGLVKNIPIYDRVPDRTQKHIKELQLSTDFYKAANSRTKHNREAAERSSEDNRLVLGRQSPTRLKSIDNLRKSLAKSKTRAISGKVVTELESEHGYDNFDSLYATTERNKAAVLRDIAEKHYPIEPEISPVALQLQHREWSGQYRAQVVTDTPPGKAPAPQYGERFSETLTAKAVSKIFETGAYVAQCHGGFTTFITLTFNNEQRQQIFGGYKETFDEFQNYYEEFLLKDEFMCELKNYHSYTPIAYGRNMARVVTDIAGPYSALPILRKDKSKQLPPKLMNATGEIAGDFCLLSDKPEQEFERVKLRETTIGKETSRFIDGMKKMYHRGWKDGDEHVPGHAKASEFGPTNKPADFHYMWVAECPPNEDGEPNPHVHLIVRWTVEQKHFQEWARRLEGIWGHGMAHIERIQQPMAASTYMIKAIGYAAKGENADQGLIKGNRYNIARCSRAPQWETLASFEVGNITAVIKELGYKLEQWKKPIERRLAMAQAKRSEYQKAYKVNQNKGVSKEQLNKVQQRLIKWEKTAEKAKKELKSREVHVSTLNRFSISFDGEQAKQKADDFLVWAAGARGWSMECRDADLTDIRDEAKEYYSDHYQHFLERRAYWKSVLSEPEPLPEYDPDEELSNTMHMLEVAWGYKMGRATSVQKAA